MNTPEPMGNDLPDAINPRPRRSLMEHLRDSMEVMKKVSPPPPSHIYIDYGGRGRLPAVYMIAAPKLEMPPIQDPFKFEVLDRSRLRYHSSYGLSAVPHETRCLLMLDSCDGTKWSKQKERTHKQKQRAERKYREKLRRRNPTLYAVLYGDPVKRRAEWRRSAKGRTHLQRVRYLRTIRNR